MRQGSAMREKTARLAVAGLWATAVLIATVGVASASSGRTPILSMTPSQILATSLAAARSQKSATATEIQHEGGTKATQKADSFQQGGEQVLGSSTGAAADIRLLKGVVYLKDNAQGIKMMFGVSDAKWANKWIKVTSKSSAFAPLSSGITFPSLLSQLPPTGKLTKSKVESVGGHQVIAISGKPNQASGPVSGTEIFYVSTVAPYLPIEMTGNVTAQGHKLTLTISMSNWKRTFSIATPNSSTPINKTNLP